MVAIATRMDATWGEILDALLPVSTHGHNRGLEARRFFSVG
jgi:hypothetical protein